MITLVDYGLGNIQAFANIYKRLGYECSIKVMFILCVWLLLGTWSWCFWLGYAFGSFRYGSCARWSCVELSGPVLGICVGMQMMANRSDEGRLAGLGWIREKSSVSTSIYSPLTCVFPIWAGMTYNPRATPCLPESWNLAFTSCYYFFVPESPSHALAEADYCQNFSAAVGNRHVLGVQFHREKSSLGRSASKLCWILAMLRVNHSLLVSSPRRFG